MAGKPPPPAHRKQPVAQGLKRSDIVRMPPPQSEEKPQREVRDPGPENDRAMKKLLKSNGIREARRRAEANTGLMEALFRLSSGEPGRVRELAEQALALASWT